MSSNIELKIEWAMGIDLDKCTGCGACMVTCQVENNIAPEVDASNKLRSIDWMKIYKLSNGKSYPDHDVAYLPRPCMQCGHPSCATVCPVVATTKDEEGGIVSQVYPRCIGCRYCMAACPYHARYFNWADPVWPKGMEKTFPPNVSIRPRGVVEKCTFCHHLWDKAKEKARIAGKNPMELAEDAYVPACVQGCPSGAMIFGDVKNEKHLIHKLVKGENVFRLLERLKTHPQVYYYSKREWVRKLGDNYLKDEKKGA